MRPSLCTLLTLLALVVWLPATLSAATLPRHRPLRVLIVSDEVNPHALPASSLTQPGEIAVALRAAGSGLNLDPAPDGVVEIATNEIEQATALLSVAFDAAAAYDVLIYFAHRIPDNGNDALGRQAAFTDAVSDFLVAGGGVVAFHHGMYIAAGKEGILDLIGATASGNVPWDTLSGQNVIATAPDHFVTCTGVDYPTTVAYADPARGVAASSYPMFNNTPDERYPFFEYNASALGNVSTLFGSDYVDNGTTHLLGFVHRRPAWSGRVVGYQPGEYQPNALDDVDGNNFQVLVNAIVFAAGEIPTDGVVLEAERGALSGEVALAWTACDGTFRVQRSTQPMDVADAANELVQTTGRSWSDLPPAGGVFYYQIIVD